MNKKALSLPSGLLLSAALILPAGCKQDEQCSAVSMQADQSQQYVKTLLELHEKYCVPEEDNAQALEERLKNDSDLKPAANFEGIYEVTIDNVSFAISPEEDGCTTDVMLKSNNNKPLFTFEDIDKALTKQGYMEVGKPKLYTDSGTDNSKVNVIEKKYISPDGYVTTLRVPIEEKDKFYMTLFTEKWPNGKPRQKLRALKHLKMA